MKKNPDMFEWRTAKNRIVRRLTAEDLKVFRMTPALEQAGYRVPPVVLIREGYVQKRKRQVIMDAEAARIARERGYEARQLAIRTMDAPAEASEPVPPLVRDGDPEPDFDQLCDPKLSGADGVS